MKNLCFFYGTLRSGYWNNQRVITPSSQLIGPAITQDNFRLFINGNIPCAVPDNDGYPLIGEVWELSREDAQYVQSLEYGYDFKEIIVLSQGQPVTAGIYFCARPEDSPYFTTEQREEPTGDFSHAVKPQS